MARSNPSMETVKASDARQHFSELVNRVNDTGARVVIEKNGAAVAGIVSRHDLRLLRNLDERAAAANEAIDRFQAAFDGVPESELEAGVEKAIAEVRAERRAALLAAR